MILNIVKCFQKKTLSRRLLKNNRLFCEKLKGLFYLTKYLIYE